MRDTFPPIERNEDGWYRQCWDVGVCSLLPANLEALSAELQEAAVAKVALAWEERGEDRRDPIRVTCRAGGPSRIELVVEVKSEHPDWRLGAIYGTIQEVDRRLGLVDLQGLPRGHVRPWYLAKGGDSG